MESVNTIAAKDLACEQETRYVQQNKNLMAQIASSLATHEKRKGYQPTTPAEMQAIAQAM